MMRSGLYTRPRRVLASQLLIVSYIGRTCSRTHLRLPSSRLTSKEEPKHPKTLQAPQSTNITAQSLTYLKFDFSDYSIDQIDAAKVRFYVNANATGNAPFTANLYGIRNKTWTADTLTWNDAPNHDGVDISGVNGSIYWHASSSPSWDPILQASYYDLDASDYIINHCSDKIASFILQAQVNETSFVNGATIKERRALSLLPSGSRVRRAGITPISKSLLDGPRTQLSNWSSSGLVQIAAERPSTGVCLTSSTSTSWLRRRRRTGPSCR